MVIACHCEGKGWKFWGDSNLRSKFWGRSIQLDPVGILTLEFDDGEIFTWSKVLNVDYLEKASTCLCTFGYPPLLIDLSSITGHHKYLQSYPWKTILRSPWNYEYTREPSIFM